MLTLIKKLITGPDELPEITALREVLKQNREDAKTLLPWARDAQNNPELQEMYREFRLDISNIELGEKIIKFAVELSTEAPARDMLHQISWPTVQAQNTARLRPALKSALEAIIGKLEVELDEVNRHDTEHAARYGLSHSPGPVASQLNRSLGDAQSKLKLVETADANALSNIVTFVLSPA
jgi:hypothetical protein